MTAASSRLSSVEPAGTLASFAMLADVMCSVESATTVWIENAGVYESSR